MWRYLVVVWGGCLEEYVVPFERVFCFDAANFGCGILLFCCLPFFFLCRSLMGLLCIISKMTVFVVCLVVGRFDFAFGVKSLTRRLIMQFVAFSFCVGSHIRCWFICGCSCAVVLFLHCPFVSGWVVRVSMQLC